MNIDDNFKININNGKNYLIYKYEYIITKNEIAEITLTRNIKQILFIYYID